MSTNRTMSIVSGGDELRGPASRPHTRVVALVVAIVAMLGVCVPTARAQTLRVQGQPWTLEVPAGWRVASDAKLAAFNNTTYTASGGRSKPAQVMLVRAEDENVSVMIMGEPSAEVVPSLDELARQFAEQGQKVAPGLGLSEVSFDRDGAMGTVVVRMDAGASGGAAMGGGARVNATMLRFGRSSLVSIAGVAPAGAFAAARPQFAAVARAVKFDAGQEHPEMSTTAAAAVRSGSGGSAASGGAASAGESERSMLAVGAGLGVGVTMLGVAVVLAVRLRSGRREGTPGANGGGSAAAIDATANRPTESAPGADHDRGRV